MQPLHKKILMIAGAAFVVLTILYSGIWYYQAKRIQSLVISLVEAAVADAGDKDTQNAFFYTTSGVSGFPFAFKVEIEQPRLALVQQGKRVHAHSNEPLVVGTNLFADTFIMDMPQHLQFDVSETNNSLYFLDFNNVPHLEFGITRLEGIKRLMPWMFRNLKGSFDAVFGQFRFFSYKDTGYTVRGTEKDGVLASSEGTEVSIHTSEVKPNIFSTRFFLEIKDTKNDLITAVSSKPEKLALGDFTALIDVTHTGPALNPPGISEDAPSAEQEEAASSQVEIRSFQIDAEPFSAKLEGAFGFVSEDDYPSGKLSITLRDYEKFVDYQAAVLSHGFATAMTDFFQMNDAQIKGFKRFLQEISTPVASAEGKTEADANMLHIAIKREPGEDLFIGDQTLPKVMALFKRRVVNNHANSYVPTYMDSIEEDTENTSESTPSSYLRQQEPTGNSFRSGTPYPNGGL